MAARVGPSPQGRDSIDVNNPSEVEALRAHFAENRKRRRSQYDENGLAVNSGWMKRTGKVPMKTLTASNGSEIRTPDVIDWDDWLDIFTAKNEGPMSEEYKASLKKYNARNLADLADFAFNVSSSKQKYRIDCKGGHILSLDYQAALQVLKVKFWNGSVVCYFYVPKGIYSTLERLAQDNQTRQDRRGKDRHLVGIYFWDLVRVRGTIHGNRYECVYVIDEGGAGGYEKRSRATKHEIISMKKRDIKRIEESIRKMKEEDRSPSAAKELEAELERKKADLEALENEVSSFREQ